MHFLIKSKGNLVILVVEVVVLMEVEDVEVEVVEVVVEDVEVEVVEAVEFEVMVVVVEMVEMMVVVVVVVVEIFLSPRRDQVSLRKIHQRNFSKCQVRPTTANSQNYYIISTQSIKDSRANRNTFKQ